MTDFSELASRYEAANQIFWSAMGDASVCRTVLADEKAKGAAIEADVMINGEVIGNNAEARKAGVTLVLSENQAYKEHRKRLNEAQSWLDSHEADRDRAANQMSVLRRQMDYAIQELALQAATKAGLGAERG